MSTVIRRSADPGDVRQPRVPFTEPGTAQPTVRLSALAFQGRNGDPTPAVASPEGGALLHPGGQGTAAKYDILATGQPTYGFDASLPGANPELRPTLYDLGTGRAQMRSMIAVMRLVRFPTSDDATPADDTAMHVVRAGVAANNTLAIIRPTAIPDVAKRIAMRGLGGSWVYGPEYPDDGGIHFLAAVFDGTTGRLHVDSAEYTGPVTAPNSSIFCTGFARNGGYYQLLEAAHYSTALTRAQVEAKRQHYRALYQF